MYLSAIQLAEGGTKVRLMYWDVKPLIENLGFGTVEAVLTFFGNKRISQMYGSVLDSAVSEILQHFLKKFVSGDHCNFTTMKSRALRLSTGKNFLTRLLFQIKNFSAPPLKIG